MTFKRLLLFGLLLNFKADILAQKNCNFKIDTASILSNQNLDHLLIEFKTNSLRVTNDIKDIPAHVKKQLDCLANDFSIANPGQPYQVTDVVFKKLPWRQLVFLAKNDNLLVMTYLKGGWGVMRYVLFIKFNETKIIDFWSGYCLKGLETKAGIINYIQTNKGKINGLNSNAIYF